MSNKISNLTLGAMLGLGTLAFTGTGASAAAMLPLSTPAIGEANAVNGGVIQVKHRNRRRHHFDGSFLFLPLVLGGGYGGYDYYDYDYGDYDDYDGGGLSSRHIRYCLNKYQSYNPRNNTWVAYSGKVKKCYSPYL